jgi:hypothetical protein
MWMTDDDRQQKGEADQWHSPNSNTGVCCALPIAAMGGDAVLRDPDGRALRLGLIYVSSFLLIYDIYKISWHVQAAHCPATPIPIECEKIRNGRLVRSKCSQNILRQHSPNHRTHRRELMRCRHRHRPGSYVSIT